MAKSVHRKMLNFGLFYKYNLFWTKWRNEAKLDMSKKLWYLLLDNFRPLLQKLFSWKKARHCTLFQPTLTFFQYFLNFLRSLILSCLATCSSTLILSFSYWIWRTTLLMVNGNFLKSFNDPKYYIQQYLIWSIFFHSLHFV